MTNLVSKLQPWRSSGGRWEPHVRTLFTAQGKAESHTDLALCRGTHWSASSTFAARFPPAFPFSLPRHGPSGVLRCLPSCVARYTPWLLKPLERVRWLRYSVSSYARFVYQTVGGDCTGAKQNVACKEARYAMYINFLNFKNYNCLLSI